MENPRFRQIRSGKNKGCWEAEASTRDISGELGFLARRISDLTSFFAVPIEYTTCSLPSKETTLVVAGFKTKKGRDKNGRMVEAQVPVTEETIVPEYGLVSTTNYEFVSLVRKPDGRFILTVQEKE